MSSSSSSNDASATTAPSASAMTSFYCHRCNQNFRLPSVTDRSSEDTVCPQCQSGFIEETDAFEDPSMNPQLEQPLTLFEDLLGIRPLIGTSPIVGGGGGSGGGGVGLNHVLQELRDLLSGIDNGGDGRRQIHFVQPGMTMYSNPGDYVFGRGGIDAIVTQILNQPLEGAGAPPLEKHLIQKIPTVKITQGQVDLKLQCSVCWDDFVVDESVRELKCEHVFHESCIVPWLELHGTCPVCRKSQQDEDENADHSGTERVAGAAGGSSVGESNAPLITEAIDRLFRRAGLTSSPTTHPSSPPSATASAAAASTGGGLRPRPSNNEAEDSTSARRPRLDYDDLDLE